MMKEHDFTPVIRRILSDEFCSATEQIFGQSDLLQYINVKTVSASRGSKSRGLFGSLYAIYVLVEDYVNRDFHISGDYGNAEGVKFSDLFRRQRELPFGSKLQNHALNHRLNQEFRKYFPISATQPILRDTDNHQYWINEHLLQVDVEGHEYNIAEVIIRILDAIHRCETGIFSLIHP